MRITISHVLPRTAPAAGKTPRSDVRVFVAGGAGKEHEQAP